MKTLCYQSMAILINLVKKQIANHQGIGVKELPLMETKKGTEENVIPTKRKDMISRYVKSQWTEWEGWSECSQSCGKGTKIRNRRCNNDKSCIGSYIDGAECEGFKCKRLIVRQFPNGEYRGEITNGLRNGFGIQKYSSEGRSLGGNTHEGELLYEGHWKDDVRSGFGKLVFNNKSEYEGEFSNDIFNGKGKLYSMEGFQYYEGEFFNGKADGKGKEYALGTLIFEGEYQNGKRNGYGTLYLTQNFLGGDGGRYEGQFRDGKMNGKGTMYNVKGNIIYEGHYRDGKPNGQGKLIYTGGEYDGDYFIGHFKEGMADGKGKYYKKDGHLLYEGYWRDDKFDGKGDFFPTGDFDGDRYSGDFSNGKMHGFGKYYKQGTLFYEGQFLNDQANGHGTFYHIPKEQRVHFHGEVVNWEPVNPEMENIGERPGYSDIYQQNSYYYY